MALEVNIKKQFDNFILDVNFVLKKGILGVLGASGCGKSMTLKCIAGIETPDTGRIVLNGRILFDSKLGINLPPQQRNVGYLFQNYALFPHMTVEDNIAFGIKEKDKKTIIDKYVNIFRLNEMRKLYPRNLSGGQQQRVALARIFASKPDILMLDEPFSALDDFLKWQVEIELRNILNLYVDDILFVSHNRDEIYRFCDEVAVLSAGKITAFTTKKALFEKPQTLEASKLSGCKNHSRIEKIDDYTVKAIDWNLILKLDTKVMANDAYIGIRAHEINIHVNKIDKQNIFAFTIEHIIENIFSIIFMVRAVGAKNMIRVEFDKEYWHDDKKVGDEIYLELEAKHLFLLRD